MRKVIRALRWVGNAVMYGSALTRQDIYFIISLIITVLNMILEYLRRREEEDGGEDNRER